jgi:ABC-type branched-subunit amino acid transport system ATPase component/ABC-type branched-subunit amino acid transport system permease subunit
MTSRWTTPRALSAGLLVVALTLPLYGPSWWLDLAILSMIFAIMAIGLNLLMGYTGLDSLGQAGFYGTAAYVLGIMTSRWDIAWSIAAPAGIVVGTALAALTGLIAVRLRGLLFLLVTLAFGQLLWGGANRWGKFTGGANGLSGVSAPASWLRQTESFYYLALFIMLAAWALSRVIINSPFGLSLRGIRERETRSASLGFHTYRHKYVAFVIAGFFASIAGILSASYNRFVSPRDLSLGLSFEAMLMVIVGGAGTVAGPVIGAFAVTGLRYNLSIYFEDWWLIMLGSIFVLATIYLPDGITGAAARISAKVRSARGTVDAETQATESSNLTEGSIEAGLARSRPRSATTPSSKALELRGLHKKFGDLTVLDGIDLTVEAGERVGVIGLNGAGKTTLFHVVSGIDEPSKGSLSVFGTDVTKLPAHTRAGLGMTRTFQITLLYPKMTARENMVVALMGWKHREFQFVLWRSAHRVTELNEQAHHYLSLVGLEDLASTEVRYLSYGHQRQLEIALALAGDPTLLLLDEPTAGLAHAEIDGMRRLLKSLPKELTVLIVEHHLEVIFEFVERVVVLHEGGIIADGTPESIRNNPLVRSLYFGIAPDVQEGLEA